MKRIYFVRHGQVESNIKKLHQGPDDPLTELGRTQSEFIAERASNLPIELLIASPYLRARQTAERIAHKIDREIEYSDLFVECRAPKRLVGFPEASSEAQEAYEIIRANYGPGYRFEDEETYDEHISRAKKALELLVGRPEQTILVVTHGAFLKILIAHVVFDMQPSPQEIQRIMWHLDTQNTGITVFTHDPSRKISWKLWIYNDHAHLAE